MGLEKRKKKSLRWCFLEMGLIPQLMPVRKPAPHKNVIRPLDPKTGAFNRSLNKRGIVALKKVHELTILTGAEVFLSIVHYDPESKLEMAATFTSEEGDWRKHAFRLSQTNLDDAVRLDTRPCDYFKIFDNGDPPSPIPTRQRPRSIRQPWMWLPTTQGILLPQLLGKQTESNEDITVALEVVKPEIGKYGGEEQQETFQIVQSSPNAEEKAEQEAVQYDDAYLEDRSQWWVLQEKQRKLRLQVWNNIY